MKIKKEIVLPSGRFAAFRAVTAGDLIKAYSENAVQMQASLAMLVATIDGAAITREQIDDMPLDDFMPLCAVLGDLLPRNAGKGVA
jgi:hypothetical protein